MKIHNVEQGTLDWLNLHLGIPTASCMDAMLTPEFKIRTGEMPRTLAFKKVAEAYRRQPLINFNTFVTEQGMIVEEEARPFFELVTGIGVDRAGFITSDDGLVGCSPDGLLRDPEGNVTGGLEIKCPAAETHVRYLVEHTLPKDYRVQVHTSMYVTGLPVWTFMSYRRKFPPLILAVERSEAIQTVIAEAVKQFYLIFNEAFETVKGYESSTG